MPEIIAAGTALANSADIVIGPGGTATFLLKGGAGADVPFRSVALIQAKGLVSGQYVTIGQLDSAAPIRVLTAAGTFRVSKLATDAAVGVDQN